MAAVKSKRRYDASGRRDQARRNQEAILDAAERQFLEQGYGATSIAAIAEEARVSVQTIYAVFGGKSGLVRAIYERGLLGRGDTPAYDRSDEMRERETDPVTIMQEWGMIVAEIASVVSPIRLLMRAAALTDPEIEEVLQRTDEERIDRMRHHGRFLKRRGYLREGVSAQDAADVMYVCTSVELYDLLVVQRGWSLKKFGRYVADFMITSLLPTSPRGLSSEGS